MPRPSRPWFRFYVETFPDRKIRRLDPAERWVWAAVLGAARESPEVGRLMVAEGMPMTLTELAEYADVTVKLASRAVDKMVALGIVIIDSEVMCVPKFGDRQFESDVSTARTRAFRERSRNDVGTSEGTTLERSRNGRRNAPETETETETERPSLPRKRGTRLPDNWTPNPELVAAMRAEGIPDLTARRELPRFRDYWRAKPGREGVKLDWDATWRNWLRRAGDSRSTPPERRRPEW